MKELCKILKKINKDIGFNKYFMAIYFLLQQKLSKYYIPKKQLLIKSILFDVEGKDDISMSFSLSESDKLSSLTD